jgi:hypothetical protein
MKELQNHGLESSKIGERINFHNEELNGWLAVVRDEMFEALVKVFF